MKNKSFKKSLIALSASVAILSAPLAADVPKLPALDYVPADTALFSGSLEPFPLKTYLKLNADILATGAPEGLEDMFDKEEPAQVFFGSIVKAYYDTIGDADAFAAKFGFGDETRMLIYMVGFNPVVKIELGDPAAFQKLLDDAAEKSGFKPVEKELNGAKYLAYKGDGAKEDVPSIILAQTGNWITVSIEHDSTNNPHLPVVLGTEMPAESLGKTSILQDLTDKYGFDGTQLAYIDHRIIIDKITNTTPIDFIPQKDWDDMKDIQTEACRAEFAAIAASWPRTVAGNKYLTITDTEYSTDSRMIIESTNATTNEALMGLRGTIPAHVSSPTNQFVSVALGINASQMTGSLTTLWSSITQQKYGCESLQEMQKGLAQANPAMLGMFAGMAQGVMGLSATVYEADIDMSQGQPRFNKLDALISLAAENPASLLVTGAMMLPPLGGIKLPDDGTPIVLNDVLPPVNMIGGKTLAAAVGKHLNVYQDDKANSASKAMSNEAIDANGFFSLYIKYDAFFKLINKIMADTGEDVPAQFKALETSDLKLGMAIDFTEHGIEIAADIEMKK